MKDESYFVEKELDDFLDMVKRQLKNYVMMMLERKHHELYAEHQKLLTENKRLREKLEEHQIIWEK